MNNSATMPVEFSVGAIHGRSVCTNRPAEASLGNCDVLILSLGPQERCCAIASSDSTAALKSIIVGETSDFQSNDPDAEQRIKEYYNRLLHVAGSNVEPSLSGSPQARHQTLHSAIKHIKDAYQSAGRPLDIGIDLTCCPLFHALGLVAFVLENSFARKVSFFYAEGEYPAPTEDDGWHELFTAGDWDVAAIPGLQNPWSPRSSRRYVVSVGFEGNRTLRLCDRREPDSIVVLFPDPGIREEYADRTRRQNAAFFERFGLVDENFLRANAADAIEAWKILTDANLSCERKYSIEYLCCGTKPHALGLALRAFCSRQGVVSDIVADERLLTNVVEAGVYWRYDLRNTAAL